MILLRARLLGSAIVFAALLAPVTARAQADSRAVPPPGKALVFIYRSDRQAVAGSLPVLVNAQPAGALANGTYLVASVDPGRTFLRVGDRVITSLSLVAGSRQSYFVSVTAVPGMLPLRGELRQVGEADGRRAVEQSRFVGAGAPPVAAAPRVPQPGVAPRPPVAGVAPVAPPRPAAPPPRPAAPAPRPAAPPPAAPVARAPTRAPAPAAVDDWSLALIAKLGTFKMANASQTVGGLPSTYDTSSKSPVAGIELEMRSKDGLALGGEVFYYKNDLAANGTAFKGQQTVSAFMLNGKYYFQAEPWLYPYAGVGLGFASSSYGGDLTGRSSGLAYQGIAGVDFRFGDVGFYLQYKVLGSTTKDGAGEKVKIGGSGILVGVSFVF